MKLIRTFILVGIISIISAGAAFAQTSGSIGGSVTDALGAILVGATVTAVSADGKQKQTITNARGEYTITALAPGKYTVKAIATNFGLYENTDVVVTAGEKNELIVVLTVSGVDETVDVNNATQVSTDADSNKDATVISGKDLDALPDDPDELASALQALVGGSAGPNGGQIYIDGFTGGQLPSKDQIREIRINSNPFSAEYDRPGSGRIEILTRPGSDKWRGSVNGSFNDESLNSRNPFAVNRAPTQQRNFGGNLSGPIRKGKSSFSLDVNNRDNDNNAVINAQILDSSFNIVTFRRDVRQPTKRFNIAPRFDFAINDKNTVVARYSFANATSNFQGIGDTSLPTRAYKTSSREHEFRLTETMIINAKTVNETRFEYSDNERKQTGDNSVPTINVSQAFIGGGSSIGLNSNRNKTWELNNFTSTSFGKNMQHSFKFGGKLRHVSISDRSESNYGGTFAFPGFLAADAACDLNGDLIISSIEQYRCKVSGLVGAQYNPTQFNLTTGNPVVGVSQFEAGVFVSDDWKMRPDLLVSIGLRYENQSNISSNYNFAPRLGIAWSPGAGGAKQPKFVFRGGAGIFYERFNENNTLQALRFNGVNQLSLLVSANDPDPARRAAALVLLAQPVFTLTGVTNVPTAAQILAVLPATQSNTLRTVSPVLQAPYTIQSVFSVERALTSKLTLTSTFIASKSLHQIRTRNINAPICPTGINCSGSLRPDPALGNINAYESSATSRQTRLNLNLRANISQKISLFANYGLGFVKSDADGGSPAYSYDLTGEYSRASFDARHSFFVFGNVTLPWGISVNPNIILTSGRPFNITRGVDSNGDGFFNERPTYGELKNRCVELNLTNSFCNVSGFDPSAILPRNFGQGPSSFTVGMRVGKTFSFGKSAQSVAAGGAGGGRGGDSGGRPGGGGGGAPQMVVMGGPGGGGGGGGMGMMRMGGGGGDSRKPYNLNFSVEVQNLFNTVNLANPSGSLSNSRFGQSTSTGGGFGPFGGGGSGPNRRVNLNMRFSW
ncbi:MAG: carboxypeptidase regulatory-like domain-containing protein [Pyrinomonadaceae bacterium]|nr:TonB-dependent receptor [Chloracidobacterium sp.]